MSKGILYYITAKKLAVNLAVSIHSLRKHYDGPVVILSEGEDSHRYATELAKRYDCDIQYVEFNATTGKNTTYLNACLVHNYTPYDMTMWIDADTSVHGDVRPMIDACEEHGFAICKFNDWKPANGLISSRIDQWVDIFSEEWISNARAYPYGINCGVFSFKKDSKFMADWHGLAKQGQMNFICDEVGCQIMLGQPEYPHTMMPQIYNCSCKYGKKWIDDAVIIHWHGRKSCRIDDVTKMKKEIEELEKELKDVDFVEEKETIYEMIGKLQDKIDHPYLNNCGIWYELFEELRGNWFIDEYINNYKILKQNLPKWDSLKER